MFKNKVLENIFLSLMVLITVFFSWKLGEYVKSKKVSNEVIQINYLNSGDKINTGLCSK